MSSLANALTLLMVSSAAIIRVGPSAPVRSGACHAGTTRRANGNAGEQRGAVHNPRRRGLRIVLRKLRTYSFSGAGIDQNGHRNHDDFRRIVLTAIARIPLAIGPQPGRVARIGQNLVDRPDAEG